MFRTRALTVALIVVGSAIYARAHDTWLEVGSFTVPVGEYTYVSLMLVNHGNDHRDFKLASKITVAPCTLSVIDPSGESADLKPSLIDMGYGEQEGFWTAKYVFDKPGLHHFIHTLDTRHRTTRAIKSAKTFVWATQSSEQPGKLAGEDKCHGFGLELVLKTPPSTIEAGEPIRCQLTRYGKPLSGVTVSFVPRGVTLDPEFDPDYQRVTDADGTVQFVPQEGNMLLIVAHFPVEEEKGDGYDRTHYSAVIVLPVPNRSVADRRHR
ncbi:MAG: cobalt ABC transporter substrate-binding protein [Pirellulaceae bacterium]|nr:MAG: cobalt ABC transporter substrate-binding protein [Pirellulaceae bacterium]